MNNLPRVIARIVPQSESNPRPLDHESSALTTTPPSHLMQACALMSSLPSVGIDLKELGEGGVSCRNV